MRFRIQCQCQCRSDTRTSAVKFADLICSAMKRALTVKKIRVRRTDNVLKRWDNGLRSVTNGSYDKLLTKLACSYFSFRDTNTMPKASHTTRRKVTSTMQMETRTKKRTTITNQNPRSWNRIFIRKILMASHDLLVGFSYIKILPLCLTSHTNNLSYR